MKTVLTIAGSDSGGGAGIQADLRTFHALGVFGVSAITCVTAQNPDRITGIEPISPDMAAQQIRTVCDAFSVSAAKTGMLFSAEIIRAVAVAATECRIPNLVIDPVMVATSGTRLLREDALSTLISDLMPRATVLTPNVPEAEVLCGRKIESISDLKAAARELGQRFGTACVVKGGHLLKDESEVMDAERKAEKAEVVDALFSDGELSVFSLPRVRLVKTHGTGCVFSAALAAFLAHGETLREAVRRAKQFTADMLKNAPV